MGYLTKEQYEGKREYASKVAKNNKTILVNAGMLEAEAEYGLVEQTIYKWKKIYAPTIEVDENKSISLKEYRALQKKMRELELENEILKKATAIFAKKQ